MPAESENQKTKDIAEPDKKEKLPEVFIKSMKYASSLTDFYFFAAATQSWS